jgi:hypothetical protein
MNLGMLSQHFNRLVRQLARSNPKPKLVRQLWTSSVSLTCQSLKQLITVRQASVVEVAHQKRIVLYKVRQQKGT